MKKIILTLSIILAMTVTNSFAAPMVHRDPKAEQEFQKQFSNAKNVVWSTSKEGYLKVIFTWGGHRAEAYFDSNAEIIGTARNLFFDQLPLNVVRAFNNRFKNAVALEVVEITNAEGCKYAITLENKKGKFTTMISSIGGVVSTERIKK